jgi:prolipoprotein diacylglyceryltransferase
MAIRTVYAERWSRVVLKFIPILAVYAIAYVLAVLIALAWTAAT